jgi:hypothetical protein
MSVFFIFKTVLKAQKWYSAKFRVSELVMAIVPIAKVNRLLKTEPQKTGNSSTIAKLAANDLCRTMLIAHTLPTSTNI